MLGALNSVAARECTFDLRHGFSGALPPPTYPTPTAVEETEHTMSMDATYTGVAGKRKLRVVDQALDMDAELKAFEQAERARLGLDAHVEQWVDKMAGQTFTKTEKSHITLLVSGLTIAHDHFVEGALRGVGYNVEMMDPPNQESFQFGKEFGNRAQCNPTYFTVGNLVKFLCTLRDKHGMTAEQVVKNYVFLTAGACGPCRFGMYVTEYRKALRDAGFDGFRVVLFQQSGGLKQATGEESGLELNPKFFWAIGKAMVAGDVLNALGYRIRPYEVEPGATNRAIEASKKIVYTALKAQSPILFALMKCKPLFSAIKVDKTRAVPKISIIGEFWAMTTEGDGNYQLQTFLEQEGAEDDVQLVTAWILYTVWEGRHDTKEREDLRGEDTSYYGLGGKGPFAVRGKRAGLAVADKGIRVLFHSFAYSLGLYGYALPDMDKMAKVAHGYYNNDLRGGEGHMEVGKLILNVVGKKAHMTLSVKPFGCMPSAGVSDGVQSTIAEKFPGTIYCPVETSGDGRVNFYSRVQMYLFKAKQAAYAEYAAALDENKVTREQVEAFLAKSPKFASPLYKAAHRYAGNSADLVAAVAPYIRQTRAERWADRLRAIGNQAENAAKRSPQALVDLVQSTVKQAPVVAKAIREDLAIYRDQKARKSVAAPDLAAAAE
jgi:predicted nucleotide-binding protein (sugar kinase/HSP70/actin superfamily)